MNTLLKRQLRKYFPEEYLNEPKFGEFLEAVSRSYDTSEEQFKMTQRAMKISSDELFEANTQLRAETEQQQEILKNLRQTLDTLGLLKPNKPQTGNEVIDISAETLTKTIRKQAEELVEINKKQEKLLKNLAVQNQELNDYAHVVSHDLKSPLRSIDTLVNWLREDHSKNLNEEANDFLSKIEDQVEKMDELIAGILEYSSIDKTLSAEKPVDLNELLNEVISIISVPTHITVKYDELPVLVADGFKLKQLFQNLIVNAIKSIDKKTGHIFIGCKSIEDFYEFSVSDNGKGINAAYFKKIFEVFQKLENDSASTGIGLSIVKKVVAHYGGTVWLESEETKGTTFYFTLKK